MFGKKKQAKRQIRAQRRRQCGFEHLEGRQLLAVSATGSITASAAAVTTPPRIMEDLGRGVVAVRSSSSQALITWRLLALDPANIAFNVYRSANGGTAQKLNSSPLTEGTNFRDTTGNFSLNNTYHVRPVLGGVEQAASGSFTLKANNAVEPVVRIPLQTPATGYYTKFVWVGDLDGDGEYDYVIDRLAPFDPTNNDIGLGNQFLEAYKRDGTRLWSIDMGHNSRNTYNIEPGSSTLSMGMYDGATVYDLNSDGRAEVILKISDGVKFPDGSVFANSDWRRQYLAVLDGLTGNMIANTAFPTDFLADGSLGTQLGIGHVTGPNPNIVLWGRNRIGNNGFNDVFATYSWNGGSTIVQNWKLLRPSGSSAAQASHQMRIIDVDGDGRDEIATGNHMINSNGTMRYILPGVVHGDRFYIAKMDPNRPGLQGYGIQQNNSSGLLEYYYDATTGEMLWQHFNTPGAPLTDVGRGLVGDIDPRYPGFEVWSFYGLYNGPTNTLAEPNTGLRPWPNQQLWWDGDLLSEEINGSKLEKWDYLNPRPTNSLPRILTTSNFGAVIAGHNPMFMGDILGDWRTELVMLNSAMNQLIIFTTNASTTSRIYTMAQNPAYRAHMTIKGYLQSPMLDYYLGTGMSAPPVPNIIYASQQPPTREFSYQAEAAVRSSNVAIESNFAGYNGTGFANMPVTGGSLRWNNVEGGAGGFTTIRFRFANGAGVARGGRLTVNGVVQDISFTPTGAFSTWQALSVVVPLNAGRTNTILLESTGQDLANIDELQVAAIVPPVASTPTVTINDGHAQRSMVKSFTLSFDRPVNLLAGAVTLTKAGGAAVTLNASNASGDGQVYVFTFSGPDIVAGSLADGSYILQINAAAIRDSFDRNITGGDKAYALHRLFGDSDGDGDVDNLDLFRLRGALNVPANYKFMFDSNGDGKVDNLDLFAFRQRLGTRLF